MAKIQRVQSESLVRRSSGAKQFAAMQAAIRNTTLTELSKLSPTAKPGGFASGIKFIKRPELIGIWVRDLNKAALDRLEIQP